MPILTIITGSPHQAIATSLVAIIAVHGSSSYIHLRQGWVDMRMVFILGPSTMVGALVGALVAGFAPGTLLAILFAALLVYVSITMFLPGKKKEGEEASGIGPIKPRRKPLGIFLSGLSGVASALLGIGGGIMNVPVMHLVMGIPAKRAIATSSFLIGTTAVTGAIIYLMRGDVTLLIVPPTVIGILVGALLGSRLVRWARSRWLRVAFGILLLYTAFQMLWTTFA